MIERLSSVSYTDLFSGGEGAGRVKFFEEPQERERERESETAERVTGALLLVKLKDFYFKKNVNFQKFLVATVGIGRSG